MKKQRYLSIGILIFSVLYYWLADELKRTPGPLTIVVSLIGIVVAGGILLLGSLGGECNVRNAVVRLPGVRLLMLFVFVVALILGAKSFTIPDKKPAFKKSPELSSPKLS